MRESVPIYVDVLESVGAKGIWEGSNPPTSLVCSSVKLVVKDFAAEVVGKEETGKLKRTHY